MLRRVRTADVRRVAEIRLEVRPTYPIEPQGFAAARASGKNRWARRPRALAHRMKPGIRRLGQVLGRVARDGLAQYLRVRPLARSCDRK
jgi:hypothetical protein